MFIEEEIDKLRGSMSSKEIGFIAKNLSTHTQKNSRPKWLYRVTMKY